MEQVRSTMLRQPPYFTFWAVWFLIMAVYGVVWAAVIYTWGIDAEVSLNFPMFGGLWLGLLQGLMLRRYLGVRGWWKWVLSSSIAWAYAMIILFFGWGAVSIGGGLNPETDTRGGGVWICGFAGAIFGLIQALFPPIKLNMAVWASINALMWAVGALAGGIIGFTMYEAMSLPGRYANSHSPEYALSAAVGVFVAILVIGALTGLAAVWQLRMRFETAPS